MTKFDKGGNRIGILQIGVIDTGGLMSNIHIADKYRTAWIQENAHVDRLIENLGIDFCSDFDNIIKMPKERSREIIIYLLEDICDATHPLIIDSARDILSAINRAWLKENIQDAIEHGLDLNDLFVYDGLLELLPLLDFEELKKRYIKDEPQQT